MTALLERPEILDDVIGQTENIARLRIVMTGAIARGVPCPHVLLSGPPGTGKTTMARIVAAETHGSLIVSSGPTLRKAEDLCGILCSAEPGSVLFIDEIHRLPSMVEEVLYEALEDGTVTVIVGKKGDARSVVLDIPPIVVVGATTMPGAISGPLRDRFGFQLSMAPYSTEELGEIVARAWGREDVEATEAAALAVGERSKGVPRLALHLGQRVMDVAALSQEPVTADLAIKALEMFGVGERGLDEIDWRIVDHLVESVGRPVGLSNLAQALDLDPSTIESQHEGPLVRAGLMLRTPGGRIATALAVELMAGK